MQLLHVHSRSLPELALLSESLGEAVDGFQGRHVIHRVQAANGTSVARVSFAIWCKWCKDSGRGCQASPRICML